MSKSIKKALSVLLCAALLFGVAPLRALPTELTAAAADQEESLKTFLWDYALWFLYFEDHVEPCDYMREFSPSNPADDFLLTRLLVNMKLWCFYPLSIDSRFVTHSLFADGCTRVSATTVDYVLTNAFNLSDATINAMRESSNSSKYANGKWHCGPLYENGYYYYTCAEPCGTADYDLTVISAVESGGYVYVKYSVEVYEEDYYTKERDVYSYKTYYCKLKQKTVQGQSYWSVYRHSESRFSGFPADAASSSSAAGSSALTGLLASSSAILALLAFTASTRSLTPSGISPS